MTKYDAIKRKLDLEELLNDNFTAVGRVLNTYFSKCEEYFKEEVNRYVSLKNYIFPFDDIVNQVDGLIIEFDDLFGYGEITVKIKTSRKKFLVFNEYVVLHKHYYSEYWLTNGCLTTDLKNRVVESLNKRIKELE